MATPPDRPILFSAAQYAADPIGVAEAMIREIEAQRDAAEQYEKEHGRARPRSNWDLYKMGVHSIFTEEYESYFNSDGSYRPRDEDGYPIPPTEEELAAQRAAKTPEELQREAEKLAERQRKNAERLARIRDL